MVLTVDEVKQHLRIDNDEEDTLIEGLIRQAQARAGASGLSAVCLLSLRKPGYSRHGHLQVHADGV